MPKNEKLDTKRHSLAHLMAASILEMFPEAKFGVGPVVEDGFYYDVQLSRPLTPEDLQVIEKRMREKVKQNLRFERSEMPVDSASEMFERCCKTSKSNCSTISKTAARPRWPISMIQISLEATSARSAFIRPVRSLISAGALMSRRPAKSIPKVFG